MDYLSTLPQYCLPQHCLTRLVGKLMNCQQQFIKNSVIRWFIQQYNVDMSEALISDPKAYQNFNEFFTRQLKPGARLIVDDEDTLACPNDGFVSQVGNIESNRIFQAKGRDYSLLQLVGNQEDIAEQFADGKFATLYLSPKDYHRVHMPITGTLRKMVYVPGRLFAVKPATVNTVSGLFARNERAICLFDTRLGPMAIILVGAIIVGSIHTAWAGQVSPSPQRNITITDYTDQAVKIAKGDEMGHFQLGSTAIVLFPKNTMTWNKQLAPGQAIQLGQALGHIIA